MNLSKLPDNLPIPNDDGACSHLMGSTLPSIELHSTKNRVIDLSKLDSDLVLYFYPMTGRPDTALPDGWDEIPGARGCTPQSCSFRDHYAELQNLGVQVFGISTQDNQYQEEVATRLELPFELLSDVKMELSNVFKMPMFEVDGKFLFKRTTLIIKNGIVKKVFYPVFPPDQNASDVIEWLTNISD